MKDELKLLRTGATNKDYPLYGQYINSTGTELQTYNKEVLVCIKCDAKFKGATNFFVLETMLQNLKDYDIEQIDDIIYIKSGKLESKLIIDEVGFPEIQKPKYNKGVVITEELLYTLNYATKFTGKDHYKYVVITNKGVLATDTKKVYSFNKSMDINSNIFLDKSIINILKVGYEINTDRVIYFDNGFMMYEIEDVSRYNVDKIYEFIFSCANNIIKFCNVQYLHDAIQKISPILYAEINKHVTIFNKKKMLSISAESMMNGESSIMYDSELNSMFECVFNIQHFSNLSLDYDCYVNLDKQSYMYLKNENSEIVIMGVK